MNKKNGCKRKNHVLDEVDINRIHNNNNNNSNSCNISENQIKKCMNQNKKFKSIKRRNNDNDNDENQKENTVQRSSTIVSCSRQNIHNNTVRETTIDENIDIQNQNHNQIPLPNLNFANSTKLWNLMLLSDELYKRDPKLFSRHTSLQPIMRSTLLDWLNEVCQAYCLTRQTYYLGLDFFDRFLSIRNDCPKKNLQLFGITCLFIAAKIEEIFPPKMSRFSFVCDGACSDKDIAEMELVIMNTLKWNLRPITPIAWLNAFFKIYTFTDKENENNNDSNSKKSKKYELVNESFLIPDYDSELFVHIAHLIDLCTLDVGSLSFPYSVIAASAFYHFTNEDVVLQCTGKTINELQSCIEWMVPFAIAIKNSGIDFLHDINKEKSMIQTHTISLELLHSAQTIQADIEAEKLTVLESSEPSSSLYGPLTPIKMVNSGNVLPPTPPQSTGTS